MTILSFKIHKSGNSWLTSSQFISWVVNISFRCSSPSSVFLPNPHITPINGMWNVWNTEREKTLLMWEGGIQENLDEQYLNYLLQTFRKYEMSNRKIPRQTYSQISTWKQHTHKSECAWHLQGLRQTPHEVNWSEHPKLSATTPCVFSRPFPVCLCKGESQKEFRFYWGALHVKLMITGGSTACPLVSQLYWQIQYTVNRKYFLNEHNLIYIISNS